MTTQKNKNRKLQLKRTKKQITHVSCVLHFEHAQLLGHVEAVDEVAPKHQRVLGREHSVDPAWQHTDARCYYGQINTLIYVRRWTDGRTDGWSDWLTILLLEVFHLGQNTFRYGVYYCSIINLLWSLMSKMSTTFRSVSYGACSRTGVTCVASDVGEIIWL